MKKEESQEEIFCTNKDILVNLDINGSLNILRKYLKLKCIPKLIK